MIEVCRRNAKAVSGSDSRQLKHSGIPSHSQSASVLIGLCFMVGLWPMFASSLAVILALSAVSFLDKIGQGAQVLSSQRVQIHTIAMLTKSRLRLRRRNDFDALVLEKIPNDCTDMHVLFGVLFAMSLLGIVAHSLRFRRPGCMAFSHRFAHRRQHCPHVGECRIAILAPGQRQHVQAGANVIQAKATG